MNLILEEMEKPFRRSKSRSPQLVRPVEPLNAPKTRTVAVVVGYHDGGVEGRKVEDDERTFVECRLRFHDERLTLGCILLSDLPHSFVSISMMVLDGVRTSTRLGERRRKDSGFAMRNMTDSTLNCDPRVRTDLRSTPKTLALSLII